MPTDPKARPEAVYRRGVARALLGSEHVSEATRKVLTNRLEPGEPGPPRAFDPYSFVTLAAVCGRLIVQRDGESIDLARAVDERLAAGLSDGWRYAVMPPDDEAYRLGLRGVDEAAVASFGRTFVELQAGDQDAVLTLVQNGAAQGAAWQSVSQTRFFEELLAELAETYYSHPVAQEAIGYVGWADVPGWELIGLDEAESREPRPETATGD